MITLTEIEVQFLSESPEALRLVADYRDMQQTAADAADYDCQGDTIRRNELLAEAQRLEDSY